MITKDVKLYLGDGFPVRIPVSQFDTMWQFVFTIIHNSQPWQIPTGATAVLNGKKPDGNVFAFAGTIENNTVTVDADVQMTAVAGQTVCELSILSGGKVVGTANFILDVEAAPKSPDDVSSDSTLPAYAELLEAFSGDIESAVDSWLNAHSSQIGGLTDAAKRALLALLSHVAYTDEHGQDYLDALEDALYPPTPPANLASIEAVFTQGGAVIYDTATLDDLKPMLTVTATYDDSTTEPVSNYTLSGTLTAGTSTITVSYGGKTDTFDVTVTSSQPVEVEMVDMRQVFSTVYSDNGQTELKKGSSTAFASAETFDEDTQVTIELLYGSTNASLKQYAASWDGSGVGNESSPYIGHYGEVIGTAQTTAYTATYTVKAGNRLLIKNFNTGRWQSLTVTK